MKSLICLKFWGRSKNFKILKFENLLPKRLCRAATTKPRQIERSGFFYWTTTAKLGFTDWSRVYSMFRCGEKRDSPVVYDDSPPPLIRVKMKVKINQTKFQKMELKIFQISHIVQNWPFSLFTNWDPKTTSGVGYIITNIKF